MLRPWALAAALCFAAAQGASASVTAAHDAAPSYHVAAPRYVWHLPRGFPVPAVPADNPMSDAKVALGRRLFFDPRLSSTGRYSCASCHDPARSYSDGRKVAVGATGQALPHNAMALVNVAYNIAFGWTEPAPRSLETQMLQPMLNEHPVELGLKGPVRQIVAELARDPGYRQAFAAAFAEAHADARVGAHSGARPNEGPDARPNADRGPRPDVPADITLDHIVKAIAAFERTLISGNSPFDRYVFGGDSHALSAEAKRGMALFFSRRIGCAGCHSGFNFSGNWRDAEGRTGRASFANDGTSDRPLRVPTLRNLLYTAPYMHDGRFATLGAVLDHYVRVGREPDSTHGGTRDPRLQAFTLTREERQQLIAFLGSLSDAAFVRDAQAQAPCVVPACTRGAGSRAARAILQNGAIDRREP